MGETGAVGTVLPDLVRQGIAVDHLETVTAEEAGLVGQGEDPGDAQFLSLYDQLVYDAPADSAALASSPDGQRPHLRQVVPDDDERSAPDHLSVAFGDDEIPDLLEEAVDRHRKEDVLFDVGLEDLHDLGDVPDHGRADDDVATVRCRRPGCVRFIHDRSAPLHPSPGSRGPVPAA